MKKLLITCTALLLSGAAFAQNLESRSTVDWNPDVYRIGELYPGYIIKLEGDTVNGFIKAKQPRAGARVSRVSLDKTKTLNISIME